MLCLNLKGMENIELELSEDEKRKVRRYKIRNRIRQRLECLVLTDLVPISTELHKDNKIHTFTLFRHKKTELQNQKNHNNKAAKQLSIEAAKRAANAPSNGIKVSLDSQAAKKLKYTKRAEQRQKAILKHCVKVLIN